MGEPRPLLSQLSEGLPLPCTITFLWLMKWLLSTNLPRVCADNQPSQRNTSLTLKSLPLLKKEIVLIKDSLLMMELKTFMFHLLETSKLLFTPRLKLKDQLTNRLLSSKLPVPNVDNLPSQRNIHHTPRNSIANLRKVHAPVKDIPFRMDQKTLQFHSLEPSTPPSSKNLLLLPRTSK